MTFGICQVLTKNIIAGVVKSSKLEQTVPYLTGYELDVRRRVILVLKEAEFGSILKY